MDQFLVIIDIEATCWEKHIPEGEQNEIIEIGICLLNTETLEISDKRGLLVKPTRSKVSKFCTELTTLTQKQVDGGMTFAKACGIVERDYATKSRRWASWGAYDQRMFEVQCVSFGVPYPFGEEHTNLKQRFAELGKLPKQIGMAAALKQTHIELNGTHHRGVDDAYNIAQLAVYMLKRYEYREIFE